MRRLVVLNIIEEGRFGGPQQRIAEVAAGLRSDHAIDTVVVLPETDSERFCQALQAAGVEWRAIRLHRLTRHVAHLLRYVAFFVPEVFAIRSVIRSLKPDLVHCNGSWQVKGMIAARLAGVRRVWHMNDTFMPAVVRPLFGLVYRLCPPDAVVLASRRTGEYYFASGKYRRAPVIQVIRPSVDTARFDPTVDLPNPYPDAGFDGVRVLTVGNVNPVKDHELLIRVAHEMNVRGRGSRVRFYVAGSVFENQRPYYEQLRRLATELAVANLEFLGARADVPALMRHAHVFVCTSQYEGGPMVVWEALAMALPVVSTDVGDLREIFDEHRCGVVARSRDPRELADLLEQLVDSPEPTAAMAERGRQAVALFDVGHTAERHAACYRAVVARC